MSHPVADSRCTQFWVVIVASALCVGGFVAWRYAVHRQSDALARSVERWVTPELRTIKTQVNATGVVRLRTGAEVRVGAQLSGIVRKLFVTVGSAVTQGQVIASIDASPIETKVQQAKAQLAQARVSLAKTRIDADRSSQLFDEGIISKQQFQDSSACPACGTKSGTSRNSRTSGPPVD